MPEKYYEFEVSGFVAGKKKLERNIFFVKKGYEIKPLRNLPSKPKRMRGEKKP